MMFALSGCNGMLATLLRGLQDGREQGRGDRCRIPPAASLDAQGQSGAASGPKTGLGQVNGAGFGASAAVNAMGQQPIMPPITQPSIATVYGPDHRSVRVQSSQAGENRKTLLPVAGNHNAARGHDGGRIAQNFILGSDHLRKTGPVVGLLRHRGAGATSGGQKESKDQVNAHPSDMRKVS